MKSFFTRFINNRLSRVVINGKTYTGNTVSIIDGCVVVDGVKQEGTLSELISIAVYGDQSPRRACSGLQAGVSGVRVPLVLLIAKQITCNFIVFKLH